MTTSKNKKAKPRARKQIADEKYLGLTEQEFNRFRQACRTTWNAIAHLVMIAGVEVEGKMSRRSTLSNSFWMPTTCSFMERFNCRDATDEKGLGAVL